MLKGKGVVVIRNDANRQGGLTLGTGVHYVVSTGFIICLERPQFQRRKHDRIGTDAHASVDNANSLAPSAFTRHYSSNR